MDKQRIQEYEQFLIKILQATYSSKANPEVIYPLLLINLDKLDRNLIVILQYGVASSHS